MIDTAHKKRGYMLKPEAIRLVAFQSEDPRPRSKPFFKGEGGGKRLLLLFFSLGGVGR